MLEYYEYLFINKTSPEVKFIKSQFFNLEYKILDEQT